MPECRKGLRQDVSSADESGIALVIAGDTSKHLSLAVAPIVLTTSGTCSGGAFSDRRQSAKHGFPRPDIRSAASPAGRSKGGGFAEVLSSGLRGFKSQRRWHKDATAIAMAMVVMSWVERVTYQ